MYNWKQIFMSITSIHRENNTNHGFESSFLLLIKMPVHGCSSYNSLLALLLNALDYLLNNVAMYNEGVYIRFPSWTLKLSNLTLNSYLTTLSLLNADYLPKDESLKAQGPFTIYKGASS